MLLGDQRMGTEAPMFAPLSMAFVSVYDMMQGAFDIEQFRTTSWDIKKGKSRKPKKFPHRVEQNGT